MAHDSILEQLCERGYVVLPGFYEYERDVSPIREGIRRIVEAVAEEARLDVPCADADAALGPGIMALARHDRALVGQVYDAVKQIPAFMTLVSHPRNATLFETLRPGATAGLAAGGYGIRIDLPKEEKFRTFWHQEFPAQLRSADGLVFWSPLVEIHDDLGPVEIAERSHENGMLPVYNEGGRSGAYALRLADEAALIARYDTVAPLSSPGDLIVMDFMTLHRSGRNVADAPRWSMQFRYFNFADPLGRKIAWQGSYAAGIDFAKLFPDLLKENTA